MLDKNKQVAAFILCDLINGLQDYITGGTLKDFQQAKENGCAFLAEYTDGTKSLVEPEEIDLELTQTTGHINIVEQEIFVPIMESLIDLMEESMTPAVSVLSITPGVMNTAKTINNKFDRFKQLASEAIERYKPNIEEETDGDSA